MNRPPGPHDSMHARRTEHRPSRSGEWGYIGHATTIRSGTDNTGGEFGQLSLGNDLSSVRSATQPDLTGNTAAAMPTGHILPRQVSLLVRRWHLSNSAGASGKPAVSRRSEFDAYRP